MMAAMISGMLIERLSQSLVLGPQPRGLTFPLLHRCLIASSEDRLCLKRDSKLTQSRDRNSDDRPALWRRSDGETPP